MKLNKEQIQSIDAYLQRSGVSYLDIRMELLDHYIEAVEEKLTTTELSFDEALMEVTVAFGNSIQERHLLNKDKTIVLFSGIFSNNKGFKELEEEKRKQIKKQYFKQCIQQLKENFMRIHFYADYICFALMSYIMFQHFGSWVLIAMSIWLTFEIILTFYNTRKYKFTRDSLRGEISSKVVSVFFSFTINLFMLLKINKGVEVQHIFWVVLMTLACYPLIKAVLTVHKNIYAKYKKYYELISA
jgi:hypothetical protein